MINKIEHKKKIVNKIDFKKISIFMQLLNKILSPIL